MTVTITDSEIVAKHLAVAIADFGTQLKLVPADAVALTEAQLLHVLLGAKTLIDDLQEKVRKVGKVVDIFWERQGYYIVEVDTQKVSVEHSTIDLALKSASSQGYIIREVRRTRGSVAQPKVPLPEKRDVE